MKNIIKNERGATVKARFKLNKNAIPPLDNDQATFVSYCIERNNRAYDLLLQNPSYIRLVVPELIDSSKRVFKGIPIFTYILWTGDKDWMHLLIDDNANIDPEFRLETYENLLKQLKSFLKSGVTFSVDGHEFTKQYQYSDKEHIDALMQYVKQYPGLSEAERKAFWVNVVGNKQRMVEKHIALKLCHVDHTPSHRLSIFATNEKIQTPVWFPLADSRLGKDYAICLSNVAIACEAPNPAQVLPMIQRLEAIEQARSENLQLIEKLLVRLINETKNSLLSEVVAVQQSKNAIPGKKNK